MLFQHDLGEMRVWVQMTDGLDGSLPETARLFSEEKIWETWSQEPRKTPAPARGSGFLRVRPE